MASRKDAGERRGPAPSKKQPAKKAKKKIDARPLASAKLAVETIVQRVTLPTPPSAVWDAYLDGAKHARFTGAPAAIDRRVGGRFRAYDGYIEGVILELAQPDGGEGRLVQSWRASDFPPEYPHSTVEIVVAASGRGTALTLRHTGVPKAMATAFAKGWEEFYWKPLKEMLRGK